jgi:RNA polymerase sigma-70 factor (ECF subfamily)
MMSPMDERQYAGRRRAGRRSGGGEASAVHPPDDGLSAVLARALQGDEDAFRSVYRAVQPGLLRYLRALVGDDADDVASEAWSQIARDLATFVGDADGFRGWAATIARHRALDHIRYQRRRPASPTPVAELTDLAGVEDPADVVMDLVSTDAAIALIASLPRDQAEAVMLRVVMGLDVSSTARVLGKRAGAVRTAAHRGLRGLAERLAADGPRNAADGASSAADGRLREL